MNLSEKEHLENFICNNKELAELEKFFEKFNIFDCLKLTRAEIRHSNFLGWLLDPKETHGLNDYFLKEFLKKILYGNKSFKDIDNTPSIFDIDIWDMSNVEVKRESEYIDILIVDEDNKFILVIENKIDTGQHDDQLERYAIFIREEYPDDNYKKLYIYLKPEQEKVEKPFVHISYDVVQDTLNLLLEHKKDKMSNEILMAIGHYKEIIERDIMKKDDIKNICRSIYRNHKQAIDLINQYNTSINTEIMDILNDIVTEISSIKNIRGNTEIMFLTEDGNNLKNLKFGKDTNWLDGNIAGFYFGKDKTEFVFGISVQIANAEDNEKRRNLISELEKKFGKKFKGRGDHWRWLPLLTILKLEELCSLDDHSEFKNQVKEKINDSINKFNEVLNQVTTS